MNKEKDSDAFAKATKGVSDKVIRENFNIVTELASQQDQCACATCLLLRTLHEARSESGQ